MAEGFTPGFASAATGAGPGPGAPLLLSLPAAPNTFRAANDIGGNADAPLELAPPLEMLDPPNFALCCPFAPAVAAAGVDALDLAVNGEAPVPVPPNTLPPAPELAPPSSADAFAILPRLSLSLPSAWLPMLPLPPVPLPPVLPKTPPNVLMPVAPDRSGRLTPASGATELCLDKRPPPAAPPVVPLVLPTDAAEERAGVRTEVECRFICRTGVLCCGDERDLTSACVGTPTRVCKVVLGWGVGILRHPVALEVGNEKDTDIESRTQDATTTYPRFNKPGRRNDTLQTLLGRKTLGLTFLFPQNGFGVPVKLSGVRFYG